LLLPLSPLGSHPPSYIRWIPHTSIHGLDFFAFGPIITPRIVSAEVDSRLELIEAVPYHRLQSEVKSSFLRSVVAQKSQPKKNITTAKEAKEGGEAKEGEVALFVPHDLEWLHRTPDADSPLMRLNVATDSMTILEQLAELYSG
jgi:hypothetical protein